MNVSQQINQVIDKISEKVGVATDQLIPYFEKIYSLYVKQAYISGIKSVIWIVITLIISAIFIRLLLKTYQNPKLDKDNKWTDESITKVLLSILILIICFIMFLTNLSNTFNAFGNPEKWALDSIIESFNLINSK